MRLRRRGWLRLALVALIAFALVLVPLALGGGGDDDDDYRPNAPKLTGVHEAGGSLQISGTYTGPPGGTYSLDFFRSSVCGVKDIVHLGSTTVMTGASGTVTFSVTLPAAGTGRYVAATATDRPGRRSALSKCVVITQAPIFKVNSAADPGGGGCDLQECTLREALAAANATAALDVVTFSIGSGPVTIPLAAPLPSFGSSVVIDGTTQPGFAGTPLVELDGVDAGESANGLALLGDGATVKGLVIKGFARAGILLGGELGGHTVQGNTIASNGGDGIEVATQSQRNRLLDNDVDANSGLGIDLGNDGVTPNDPGDGDAGANGRQNFPVLTSAVRTGATLSVEGTLASRPDTPYAVQVFRSPSCD